MADYCVVADVQNHRPQHVLSASSKPSTTQVGALITNLSARMDGSFVKLGFVVPVTGAVSVAYLKAACSWGVAGLIEDGQVAGLAEARGSRPENRYWSIFEGMMAAVEQSPGILSDAVRTTTESFEGARGQPAIASFFTENPSDDVASGQRGVLTGGAVPRFEIRKEF